MSLSMSVPDRIAASQGVSIYQNYRRLVERMGKPETIELCEENFNAISMGSEVEYDSNYETRIRGLHPVFLLAEHFRSDDGDSYESGSFLKLHCRGDVMIVPAHGEDHNIYFLSIGFHKGDTVVEVTHFPSATEENREALYKVLSELETR